MPDTLNLFDQLITPTAFAASAMLCRTRLGSLRFTGRQGNSLGRSSDPQVIVSFHCRTWTRTLIRLLAISILKRLLALRFIVELHRFYLAKTVKSKICLANRFM